MIPPSYVLPINGNPDDQLKAIDPSVQSNDLPSILSLFQNIIHIPEANNGPAGIGFGVGGGVMSPFAGQMNGGQEDRRLSLIRPIETQNYLVDQKILMRHPQSPNTTLHQAYTNTQKHFMSPRDTGEIQEVYLPSSKLKSRGGERFCLDVEFLEGLTAPPADTPLEDILEFKQRRTDEYRQLWKSLRNIAADLSILNDENRRKIRLSEIVDDISDYEKVLCETWGRKVVNAAKLTFSPDAKLIAAFATAEGINQYFGREPLVFVAGAAGKMAIHLVKQFAPPPPSENAHGMAYLANLKRLR